MRGWLVIAFAGCGFHHGVAGQQPVSDGPGDGPTDATGSDAFVYMDAPPAQGSIAFVQGRGIGPLLSMDVITAQFMAAQRQHDLNLVVVSWTTSQGTACSGVTDLAGNTYTRIGTASANGTQNLDVFYAADIAAALAGNLVTATFDATAGTPELRILEYSGLALTSPVDVNTEANGNGSKTPSATVTTTHAHDLIVGAEMSNDTYKTPATGFTTRVTAGGDGVEDMVVTTVGSYTASATLMNNASWLMRGIALAGAN